MFWYYSSKCGSICVTQSSVELREELDNDHILKIY
jgi:hypothetical protein